jgi:hypothetical protein
MMMFTTIITFTVYLSTLTVLAREKIIPLNILDYTLWRLMSLEVYLLVGFVWVVWWYFMAQKWWKIIYIDGVYYFHKKNIRDTRKRMIKKTSSTPKTVAK